jgi:hypothetical protein
MVRRTGGESSGWGGKNGGACGWNDPKERDVGQARVGSGKPKTKNRSRSFDSAEVRFAQDDRVD